MSDHYRVDLTIGDVEYSVSKGDAPDFGLLAPLRAFWRFPQADLWPVQPEPAQTTFSLLVRDAAEVGFIREGVPVYLRVHFGVVLYDTEFPNVVVTGRVAETTGRPRRIKHQGEVINCYQLDVTAVDYVADLQETDVAGRIPQQGLSAASTLAALFELGGYPPPFWTGGYGRQQLTLDNGKVNSQTLAAAAERLLKSYADGGAIDGPEGDPNNHALYGTEYWRRGVLRTLYDPETGLPDTSSPYVVHWISPFNTYNSDSITTLPCRFGWTGNGYGPVIAPTPPTTIDATQAINADYVDFDTTWKRNKRTRPAKVIVTNNTPDDLNPSWRKVIRQIIGSRTKSAARIEDCLATARHAALAVANMYLPQFDADVRDRAETFTWRASEDPAWPILPGLFPDAPAFNNHNRPVLVHGIDPTSAPPSTRHGWYPGVLSSVEFTIQPGGSFDFEFELRPGAPLPAPIGGGSLTPDDVAAVPELAALTFNDLDPAYTFDDYRLVRTTAVDYPQEP